MVDLLRTRIGSFGALLCCASICAGGLRVPGQQAVSENRESGRTQSSTPAAPSAKRVRPPLGVISSAKREGIFHLDVVVTDASGKPVTDLDAKDFTLLDNDQPTHIFTLRNPASGEGKPEPVPELILVFDEVNASGPQLELAERAAVDFLKRNGGHLARSVSLYRIKGAGLSGSVEPSMDGNALADELKKKWEPRILWQVKLVETNPDRTADYARLRNGFSLKALGSIAIDQREVPSRKVLVWFGNGWPVDAGGDFGFDEETEIVTRLREARMTVNVATAWPNPDRKFNYRDHLAGVESEKEMSPANLALEVIATRTGGLILDNSSNLGRDIEQCAQEAGAYYSLTFDPAHTEHVDEYHDLEVQVSRPGLTARTATSYYDEPVYFDHQRPAQRVTVAQLQQLVKEAKEHSESWALRRLSGMELTERLSREKLATLREYLHKEKERQALDAVADLSAFLPPPASEIPPDAKPDRATQVEILQKAMNYLSTMVPKLPDFTATRRTVEYAEPPQVDNQTWKAPPTDQTLRAARTTLESVLYRNGDEVVETEGKARKRVSQGLGRERSLEFKGTFGGMLESILFAPRIAKARLRGSAGIRATTRRARRWRR